MRELYGAIGTMRCAVQMHRRALETVEIVPYHEDVGVA